MLALLQILRGIDDDARFLLCRFKLIGFTRLYGSNPGDSRDQATKVPKNCRSTTGTHPSSRVVGHTRRVASTRAKGSKTSRLWKRCCLPSKRRPAVIPDLDRRAVAVKVPPQPLLLDAAWCSRRDLPERVPRAADTRTWRSPAAITCSRAG
jgi:hypothetical protein